MNSIECVLYVLRKIYEVPVKVSPLDMYYLRHWPPNPMVLLVLLIEEMPSYLGLL